MEQKGTLPVMFTYMTDNLQQVHDDWKREFSFLSYKSKIT